MAILLTKWPLAAILSAFVLTRPVYSADAQSHPVLVDSQNHKIGILIGTTVIQDHSGAPARAFEVVTHSGYLAALQSDGKLAGPLELYFQDANCAGAPFAPAHGSKMINAFIPGYVFGHGKPVNLFAIPKLARADIINIKSISRVIAEGVECVAVDLTEPAFPVEVNNVGVTGIPRHDFEGVTVHMAPYDTKALGKDKKSLFNKFNTNADKTSTSEPLLRQCSPGCEFEFLANGICEPECSNAACGYDADDCSPQEIEKAIEIESTLCAPACEPGDLGDGFCDRMCNNSACNFDEGDCKAAR